MGNLSNPELGNEPRILEYLITLKLALFVAKSFGEFYKSNLCKGITIHILLALTYIFMENYEFQARIFGESDLLAKIAKENLPWNFLDEQ